MHAHTHYTQTTLARTWAGITGHPSADIMCLLQSSLSLCTARELKALQPLKAVHDRAIAAPCVKAHLKGCAEEVSANACDHGQDDEPAGAKPALQVNPQGQEQQQVTTQLNEVLVQQQRAEPSVCILPLSHLWAKPAQHDNSCTYKQVSD